MLLLSCMQNVRRTRTFQPFPCCLRQISPFRYPPAPIQPRLERRQRPRPRQPIVGSVLVKPRRGSSPSASVGSPASPPAAHSSTSPSALESNKDAAQRVSRPPSPFGVIPYPRRVVRPRSPRIPPIAQLLEPVVRATHPGVPASRKRTLGKVACPVSLSGPSISSSTHTQAGNSPLPSHTIVPLRSFRGLLVYKPHTTAPRPTELANTSLHLNHGLLTLPFRYAPLHPSQLRPVTYRGICDLTHL
jgi:hypothetical protein